jgi:hypothetical protein
VARSSTTFAKGAKPGPGRPKGSPNKASADLKQAILEALDEVGGVKYLREVAQANHAVFCSLLGRVLPMTLAGDPNNPIRYAEVELVFGQGQDALPAGVQGSSTDLETLEHRGSA